MSTITLEQAQATLSEVIHRLMPGDEVVITEGNHPVAKIIPTESAGPCRLGALLYMAPDFDAPLDDFKEYME